MVYRLTTEEFDGLGYDLDAAIAKYKKDREAHKKTEGLPAPTATGLVENIVKRHGGEYIVVEAKEYVRIADGVVLDRRKFDRTPTDPQWVPRSRDDMNVGYSWDEESQTYLKPGAPRDPMMEGKLVEMKKTIDALQKEIFDLRTRLEKLEGVESALKESQPLLLGDGVMSRE